MKKFILIPAAAGILAFGGIVLANTDTNGEQGPASTNNAEVTTVPSASENKELIGFEKAAEIALEIAEGKVTDIELSEDDGRQEYEVEIQGAEYEYDFDIDAFTGEVREQDRDRLDDDDRDSPDKKEGNGVQQAQQQNGSANLITVEKATEIAVNKTGGGTVEDVELESDDGLRYYEIEIEDGRTEFELKINATDGAILKFKQDEDDDN